MTIEGKFDILLMEVAKILMHLNELEKRMDKYDDYTKSVKALEENVIRLRTDDI